VKPVPEDSGHFAVVYNHTKNLWNKKVMFLAAVTQCHTFTFNHLVDAFIQSGW